MEKCYLSSAIIAYNYDNLLSIFSGGGETVLKVKVPPVRIENSLSPPVVGYRLFCSRRDFSDSLGEHNANINNSLGKFVN